MSHQTTIDEEHENQDSSSSLPTNQRASQSQLLTKIYYPDTLYPDNYSFFADRGDTSSSSQIKSPLPMDLNDQYPVTDPTNPSTMISTVSKQPTTEIDIIDRHTKYPVSNTDLLSYSLSFFSLYYSHSLGFFHDSLISFRNIYIYIYVRLKNARRECYFRH